MNSKCIVMWGLGKMFLILLVAGALDCSGAQPRLDQSSWKTIEPAHMSDDDQLYNPAVLKNKSSANVNKKLVEWDDDDNFVGASLAQEPKLWEPKPSKVEQPQQKNRFRKAGKLVYHGQLKPHSARVTVDGLDMRVNTYLSHSVDRNQRAMYSSNPSDFHQHDQQNDLLNYERDNTAHLNRTSQNYEAEIQWNPETDWQPIAIISKSAHANHSKSAVEPSRMFYHSAPVKITEELPPSDFKWRPITTNEVNKRLLTRKIKETVSYGHKGAGPSNQPVVLSHIEEPFEDDGFAVTSSRRREYPIFEERQKPANVKKDPTKKPEDQWMPLSVDVMHTKQSPSTEPPVAVKVQASIAIGSNHSDIAQRSASDVNYIYSSQPNSGQYDYNSDRQSYANSGYYSGYGSSYGQQPDSSGAIIDTFSGQNPEMIDRTQEPNGYNQQDYGYSYQSNTRPYSYDNSAYYTRQAGVTTQSPNRLLRQENHYHYYNSQQQPPLERQQINQAQIVREVQPLLISQPIVQQLPSSTAAPQIIREIIKEVPQAAVHFQPVPIAARILVAPPPPLVAPAALARSMRELEPSYGYGYDSYAPSRSLIRHLSQGMPSIGVRQIGVRVPVPTIQIPVRVGAPLASAVPVTRQTGSFVIPPLPQKTTTYLTETQAMPTHTTIMQTTQFTPATRTTVYTTDHQVGASSGYKKKRRRKRRK